MHVVQFARNPGAIWLYSGCNLSVGFYQNIEDHTHIAAFIRRIAPRLQLDYRRTRCGKYLLCIKRIDFPYILVLKI